MVTNENWALDMLVIGANLFSVFKQIVALFTGEFLVQEYKFKTGVTEASNIAE